MSGQDVWIEVNQMGSDIAPFCRSHAVSVSSVSPFSHSYSSSSYGGSSGHLVVQFNLTAYVKHMIEQSKADGSHG